MARIWPIPRPKEGADAADLLVRPHPVPDAPDLTNVIDDTMESGTSQQSGDQVARMLQKENNQKLAGAKQALKQKLLQTILNKAIEELGEPDAVAAEVMKQLGQSHRVVQTASSLLEKMLKTEIARRSTEALEDPDVAAQDARAELGEDPSAVIGASSMLREMLLSDIGKRALSSLQDPGIASRQAKERVPKSEAVMVQAVASLRALLIEDIARRSTEALSDTNAVVQEAREEIGDSPEVVAAASEALRALLVEEVARRSTDALTDEAATAQEAGLLVGEGHETVMAASVALKELLLDEVASQAKAVLKEANTSAAAARIRIKSDDPILKSAVRVLQATLIEEIAQQSTDALVDAAETARAAREKVSSEDPVIVAAGNALQTLLLQEVARQTTEALASDSEAANKARVYVMDDHEALQRASETLRGLLIQEIARRSTESLTDAPAAADEAHRLVGDEHEVVLEASGVLRDLLLGDIVEKTTGTLREAGPVAEQARTRIPENHASVVGASGVLRNLLIEDIIRVSTDALKDAEQAAKEAMSQVDDGSEVILKARRVLKERMLQSMLNDVIHEINDAVWSGDEDRPDFFLKKAVPGTVSPEVLPEPQALFDESDADELIEGLFGADDQGVEDVDEGLETRPEEEAALAEAVEPPGEDADLITAEMEDAMIDEFVDGFDFEEEEAEELQVEEQPIEEASAEGEPAEEAEEADTEEAGAGWFNLSELETENEDASSEETDPSSFRGETTNGEAEATQLDYEAAPEAKTDVAIEEIISARGDGASQDVEEPVAAARTEEEVCFYVYGIMSENSAGQLENLPERGIDGRYPVFLVRHEELRAIVSKVPLDSFGKAALPVMMQDTEWIKKQVRSHAVVMEKLKTGGTLVPLRFGTVHTEVEAIEQMMRNRYTHYRDMLSRIEGKKEWGLRVFRDIRLIKGRVKDGQDTVDSSIEEISKGVSQYVKQQIDRMGYYDDEESIDLMTENCIKRTHDVLAVLAEDGLFKPLNQQAQDDQGEMILNAAYLVSAVKEEAFKQAFEGLQAEFEPMGFNFQVSGPWPPYHFVDDGGEAQQQAENTKA